jgi:hypothetical protein
VAGGGISEYEPTDTHAEKHILVWCVADALLLLTSSSSLGECTGNPGSERIAESNACVDDALLTRSFGVERISNANCMRRGWRRYFRNCSARTKTHSGVAPRINTSGLASLCRTQPLRTSRRFASKHQYIQAVLDCNLYP